VSARFGAARIGGSQNRRYNKRAWGDGLLRDMQAEFPVAGLGFCVFGGLRLYDCVTPRKQLTLSEVP
jgi:hypothetical protein